MALATFRLDDSQWEGFKELCSTNDKTATEVLKAFIEDALSSRIDINKLGDTSVDPLDITDLVNQQVAKHLDNVDYLIDSKLNDWDTDTEKIVDRKLESYFENHETAKLKELQQRLELLETKLQQNTPVEATTEALGLTSDELSQLLNLSVNTIKKHRKDANYKGWFHSDGYWYKNEELPLE